MRARLYLPGLDTLPFRRLFQPRARRFYWERLISFPRDRARLRARRSECRIREAASWNQSTDYADYTERESATKRHKRRKRKLAEDESLVLNSFVPLAPFRDSLFLNL